MDPSIRPIQADEAPALCDKIVERVLAHAPGWGLCQPVAGSALEQAGAGYADAQVLDRKAGEARMNALVADEMVQHLGDRLDGATPLYAARANADWLIRLRQALGGLALRAPNGDLQVKSVRLALSSAAGGLFGCFLGGMVGLWLWPEPTAFIPFGAALGAFAATAGALALVQSPWLRNALALGAAFVTTGEMLALLNPAGRLAGLLFPAAGMASFSLRRMGMVALAVWGLWLLGGAGRRALPPAQSLREQLGASLLPLCRAVLAWAADHARHAQELEEQMQASTPAFQVTDGAPVAVDEQLADVVLPALDLLLLYRATDDEDSVREWVGEAFQKLELAGLEPILVNSGDTMTDTLAVAFRSTHPIPPGSPVRMRLPAWRLGSRILRRGEIAPLRPWIRGEESLSARKLPQ